MSVVSDARCSGPLRPSDGRSEGDSGPCNLPQLLAIMLEQQWLKSEGSDGIHICLCDRRVRAAIWQQAIEIRAITTVTTVTVIEMQK